MENGPQFLARIPPSHLGNKEWFLKVLKIYSLILSKPKDFIVQTTVVCLLVPI